MSTRMSVFRFDEERAQMSPLAHQRDCARNVHRSLDAEVPTLLHIATGGGKTFVANNVLVDEISRREGFALWITKDWELLGQAASDLAGRHSGMAPRLARLGGGRSSGDIATLPQAGAIDDLGVLYTTLHTFKARLDHRMLPRRKPCLVVWDECHWGYASATGRALRRWVRRARIPMLGLTATPRYPEEFRFACSHTFRDLVAARCLADYVLVRRATGVRWSPQRAFDGGDFTAPSLRELARSAKRNRQIVEEYTNNASLYGKTIVFACDVAHADRLSALLNHAGVAARPVHNRQPGHVNRDTIRRFAAPNREIDVVVNVAMLTHGIDIPDIRTVFLCRPTASDVLFSQMVGRGARRAPGKTSFRLVEFTDNADRFLPEAVTTDTFFGTHGGEGSGARKSRPWRHRFDPRAAPAWTGTEVPPALQDLWYIEGQTFGVEFELTTGTDPARVGRAEWLSTANALLECLADRLGQARVRDRAVRAYHTEGYDRWKVEYDSSVGWEVVSPVLAGRSGLLELAAACDALNDNVEGLGLRVNYRTGTHVHLGWSGSTSQIVAALQLTHLLEPILRTLVPPSRFAAFDPDTNSYDTTVPNQYCRPVAAVYDVCDMNGDTTLGDLQSMAYRPSAAGGRTVTFNPMPLWDSDDSPHVEIRLFGGTTEGGKLLLWVSLWMRILWAAGAGASRVSHADLADPAERFHGLDIEDALAVVPLPDENPAFVARLRERQADIFENWREHAELHAWLPRDTNPLPRTISRVIPDIASILEQWEIENPTGQFLDLGLEAQACALWCVLIGEGALPRGTRSTIELCASRLRAQGWADYVRLHGNARLYRTIARTLDRATRRGENGWLQIPRRQFVRAFIAVDGGPRSHAAMQIDDDDWQDCVLPALSRQPEGKAERQAVGRMAFEVAREVYGIQFQNYVRSVELLVDSAIDSAIRAGHIEDDGENLALLADYGAPVYGADR